MTYSERLAVELADYFGIADPSVLGERELVEGLAIVIGRWRNQLLADYVCGALAGDRAVPVFEVLSRHWTLTESE